MFTYSINLILLNPNCSLTTFDCDYDILVKLFSSPLTAL